MGQVNGSEQRSRLQPIENDLGQRLETIRGDVVCQSKRILSAAVCDYDEFLERVNELNAFCSRLTSDCGKRLLFTIKTGTDRNLLWKATVRIIVAHWDIATARIVSRRVLNLPEFLHIFTTIETHFMALVPLSVLEESNDAAASALPQSDAFTLSLLLDQMLNADEEKNDQLDECCICFERKPNTMLPCAHAYCSTCIEQWCVDNELCPLCREKIETTDDGWVIPHFPDADDITKEICSTLMDLASEPKK